jgi:hypothetical protein
VSGHSWTALREFNDCVSAMLADEDCGDDLLLVGIWMARATILNDPPRSETGGWSLKPCGEAIHRKRVRSGYSAAEHVRNVLRRDIRRYDPLAEQDGFHRPPCGAPMIRRAGECGQHSTSHGSFVDLDTGRRHPFGACSRHREWFMRTWRVNQQMVKDAGKDLPVPPANTGGVLARHLTRVDWPTFWRKLDEKWTPPPEEKPFQRPKLRLLTFELADDAEVGES